MAVKVKVENLTKIFGKKPQRALEKLKCGCSKDEIRKETGHTVGVDSASFEVNEGEIFAIMGLSGSGKSTLIRCLNLLNVPTKGSIYIDGENIVDFGKEKLRNLRQNKISMVFQHFGLFGHRTVIENVEYGLEISGVEKKKRHEIAKRALEDVGLDGWESKYPSELSGGMQQRVGLARGLANDPDILLMDEPFSALDPLIRRDMQLELIKLQSKLKKTIIFITHDINEAFRLGDRIAIMKDGVIEQIGTPQEIFDSPANGYVRSFIEDIDKTKILRAKNIMSSVRNAVYLNDDVKIVVDKIECSGAEDVFVVDKNERVQGIVKREDAIKAADKGSRAADILKGDYHEVNHDTYMQKLLALVSNEKKPIAVIDEDDKFMGSIAFDSIISALA